MGQISRMNRSARFIWAFEKLFLDKLRMTPGETWIYTGSHLGSKEDNGSEVVVVHKFKRDASEITLEDEQLFDPEFSDVEDLINDGLHERLGLSDE